MKLASPPGREDVMSCRWLRVEAMGRLEVHLVGKRGARQLRRRPVTDEDSTGKDARFSRSPCCLAGAHKGGAVRPHNPWVVGRSPIPLYFPCNNGGCVPVRNLAQFRTEV